MKKYLCLLLFTQIFSDGITQSNLRIGVLVYPNFSTGIADKNSLDSKYFRGIETFVVSYSAGIKLELKLNEKIGLSSGIIFHKNGDRSQLIPSDPFRALFSPHKYYSTLYGIEIPLNFELLFGNRLYAVGGASTTINFSNQASIRFNTDGKNYSDAIEFDYEKGNLFNFMINAGMGVIFPLESNEFRCGLYSQLYLNEGIKEYSLSTISFFPARKYFSCGITAAYMF